MNEKQGNNYLPPKQQVTKKQHYVWRGYLKRWAVADNRYGRIYTYRLHPQGNQKTIEFAKLDEVGFGKYYYDVTGFSKKDVIVLARLIESLQGNNPIKVGISQAMIADADNRRDYIERLLERYEDIDNANHFIEKIIDGDLSFFRILDSSKLWILHLRR